VTKLEARGRFHAARVYLDGEAAFCLYRKECSRYGIEEGSVISEAVYREILDDVLYPRARERMCWLLGRKDYTREQMRRKLEQGGYPEAVIGRALAYACEQRFLDDDRYVEHYLDAFRGAKSRRALLSGLMEKGIPKARAASALEDAAVEEEPQIRAFLEKRRFFSEETDEKAKQKCVAALLRKGYSWEAVRSVARGAMPDVCDM
jgi:regulatory protein